MPPALTTNPASIRSIFLCRDVEEWVMSIEAPDGARVVTGTGFKSSDPAGGVLSVLQSVYRQSMVAVVGPGAVRKPGSASKPLPSGR